MIKKVQRPSLSERFKSLSEKTEKRFKKGRAKGRCGGRGY